MQLGRSVRPRAWRVAAVLVVMASPWHAHEARATGPVLTTVALRPAPVADVMPLTACREVAHIGDSISVGLVMAPWIPNADEQLAARYHSVGVQNFIPEISGARSMVETLRNQPNAQQVVKARRANGYGGCWVIALGTNDPANTSGNPSMLSSRIDAMMALTGSVPVLWTTTKTLKDKGPYQNANMESWNHTVVKACARHPNMRVYDWAGEAKSDWFTADGIHYNTTGCRERASRIARALARAFPKDAAPSSECVVHAND